MEPVEQFSAALSTMFDHMIQANNELRQQMAELKADCDRLATDRTDALKVALDAFFKFIFVCVRRRLAVISLPAYLVTLVLY